MTRVLELRGGISVTLRERPEQRDAAAVGEIVRATEMFTEEECEVAESLVREALAGPHSGYRFWFATLDGRLAGYSCYGPVPATLRSFDLYWIAVHPRAQGVGLGAKLLVQTERSVAALGGGRLWIETSGRARYHGTRAFYARSGYTSAAALEDFYAPGDSKIFFVKGVGPARG